MRQSARAILLDDRSRLLLIRRTRTDRPVYWSTPGGTVEPADADLESTMRRELLEELGATAGPARLVFSTTRTFDDGTAALQHFFVCRLLTLDLSRRNGPEFAKPDLGGFDLERIVVGGDGTVGVNLQPQPLKAFIEANWPALTA
ncbi:NUDIX domain-containing protein [Dactylosporangium sp. CS-033363]|uniref:NUDIX domain-containing protein n=1 Tax=Dactylosporangium sp. CS-033363 TaxID=3239935 RepID=UPI003D935FDF